MKILRNFNYTICLILGLVTISVTKSIAQPLPIDSRLISFNTPQGEKLLLNSRSKADFFHLSNQFVTQSNQAYCGVASSIMVLNALEINLPESSQYKPFKVFTQENFFDRPSTREIITPEVVSRRGLTLEQLGNLLSAHGAKTKIYHGADVSIHQFRQLIVTNLKQRNNYVIINYLRKTIGQERGGHISPIAAYNEQSDRLLILDVSRYKYPPVWVKVKDLWNAINTIDSESGKTRGFILISKP